MDEEIKKICKNKCIHDEDELCEENCFNYLNNQGNKLKLKYKQSGDDVKKIKDIFSFNIVLLMIIFLACLIFIFVKIINYIKKQR